MTDCVQSSFCAPCVANQTLQMVLKDSGTGQQKVKHAGMFTEKWKLPIMQYLRETSSKVGTFAWDSNLCYSICCRPCAVGSLMERTIGMPFWFGCLFVRDPWVARNLYRYHYNIAGVDLEECLFPFLYSFCFNAFCFENVLEICSISAFMFAGVLTAHLSADEDIRKHVLRLENLTDQSLNERDEEGLLLTDISYSALTVPQDDL